MGKLTRVASLEEIVRSQDAFASIPDRPSLQIDTGTVSAEAAAQRIIDHYGCR